MSYLYSKGEQVIGDLKAADDAQRDTKIDFGEDKIDLHTSGSIRLQVNNEGVHVSGNVTCNNINIGADDSGTGRAISAGNTDTSLRFNSSDGIDLVVGGIFMVSCDENVSQDIVVINEGSNDVDFRVESNDDTHMLFVDAGNNKIGVSNSTPKTALDVHHDPTSLANDTGGGEVVKFGSGTLTAGKLYYLNGSSWAEVDADAVATGADQLLGIALGSDPSVNGVLIRGFFDANSYLSNFSAGKAVYISTTAGGMDTTAPSGAGDFVRIVGYCTTTANVIYFNPSNNWIEL